MSGRYDSWSVGALRGYVVMQQEFLSGSLHEDPLRASYVARLDEATRELIIREASEVVAQQDRTSRAGRFYAMPVSGSNP